jgi:retron-type reverse transcriptase
LKRHNGLYEKIYDFENLYQAYLLARKCKRYRRDVLEFTANLEENLIQIQNELIWKTYKVGKYREFYVYEPKKRLIMALSFKDRIVQWAIYRILNPIYDKTFISDSYACRIGKGTHKAADKLQYWLRKADRSPQKWHYLKLDISKYFYRVDHKVLIDILSRKIKDKQLLWLLKTIIESGDMKFGLPLGMEPGECDYRIKDVGMPIGNLTSQLFANVYLNELDQHIKHNLKIKRYIRYMDDIIILHPEKKQLHIWKDEIEKFLNDELKLHLNNKTAIRPITLGITFVGFRMWPTHRKMKKKSAKKMRKRLKYLSKAYKRGEISLEDINATVQSYLGIMKQFDSYNLRKKMFNDFVLIKDKE